MNAAQRHPLGVTIVAIIAFVQAILGALAAFGLLLERRDEALLAHVDVTSDTVTTYAVVALIVSAVTFLVAFALWNGADWARILIAIVQAFHVGSGLYLLVAWRGIYVWNAIFEILIALIVLWLLFGRNSEGFFARRGA